MVYTAVVPPGAFTVPPVGTIAVPPYMLPITVPAIFVPTVAEFEPDNNSVYNGKQTPVVTGGAGYGPVVGFDHKIVFVGTVL